MWKKVKSSRKISQDLNNCMCSKITPHMYLSQRILGHVWRTMVCAKSQSRSAFPARSSRPGCQSSQPPEVGLSYMWKWKCKKLFFCLWDCSKCESESPKKTLFVLIRFCEFAINLKVKVQKSVFVLIWYCWIAINVKVQINCFLVDMELHSAWKFGSAKDLFRQDTQRKWKCKNLFSGVDKTLNEVGGVTPLHLGRKQSYALKCLLSNILWSDYFDSFLKPCMQWYSKHCDNNWRICIKIMRLVCIL